MQVYIISIVKALVEFLEKQKLNMTIKETLLIHHEILKVLRECLLNLTI